MPSSLAAQWGSWVAVELEALLAWPMSIEHQGLSPAEHINWFIPEKTQAMLETAGFTRVFRSACGQSHLPILRDTGLFDPYENHSLYFECVK